MMACERLEIGLAIVRKMLESGSSIVHKIPGKQLKNFLKEIKIKILAIFYGSRTAFTAVLFAF
jgi:hypothetical protein